MSAAVVPLSSYKQAAIQVFLPFNASTIETTNIEWDLACLCCEKCSEYFHYGKLAVKVVPGLQRYADLQEARIVVEDICAPKSDKDFTGFKDLLIPFLEKVISPKTYKVTLHLKEEGKRATLIFN